MSFSRQKIHSKFTSVKTQPQYLFKSPCIITINFQALESLLKLRRDIASHFPQYQIA